MTVSAMARVYYVLIKEGSKTIDDVPAKQKAEVEYLLSLDK